MVLFSAIQQGLQLCPRFFEVDHQDLRPSKVCGGAQVVSLNEQLGVTVGSYVLGFVCF